MCRFLTGVKPPPQKKAKLSETDARYEKEKRKREPQKTWKDKRPWLQFTPDGTMICSYCVDAKIPETKPEFVAGCKSARIKSVKKHETSEVHFLPGNQGFIRATKFTALVARLLK